MHTDGNITKKSYDILQKLIDNGVNFAAATGRTRDNALGALSPLKLTLPVICDNGTLIYDTGNQKFLSQKEIDLKTADETINLLLKNNIQPFVNTLCGNNITVFHGEFTNEIQASYYKNRSAYGLSSYVYDSKYTQYKNQSVFNISMLGKYKQLFDLYKVIKDNKNLTTLFFPAHYYDGYYWLELLPAGSGKGQAIDFLRNMYKPEKVICFGDNLNDLCMFERADIKVAPSNAVDEIKKSADIIIGHCDDDSVAQYILNDFG